MTVAIRPSTSCRDVDPGSRLPDHDHPARRATSSSARQRSPSLRTSSIRPVTVTSRHSWATVGPRRRAVRGRRAAAPQDRDLVRPKARRSVGQPDAALGPKPRPDRRRRHVARQQQLDRRRGVLDHDPATRRVEQVRCGGDDPFDRDGLVDGGRAPQRSGSSTVGRPGSGWRPRRSGRSGRSGTVRAHQEARRRRPHRGGRFGSRRARPSSSLVDRRFRRPDRWSRPRTRHARAGSRRPR